MNTTASHNSRRRLGWILGLIAVLAAVIAVSAAALSDDPDGTNDAAGAPTETTEGVGDGSVPAPDSTGGPDASAAPTTSVTPATDTSDASSPRSTSVTDETDAGKDSDADNESDESDESDASGEGEPADTAGADDTADDGDDADTPPETSAVRDMDPDSSDVTAPDASIPETDEQTTCGAILDQLGEYRDLAASAAPSDLPTLQFALEEFEHEVDFLGDGHDWANALVEQLVIVRREWSTAYASAESGESAAATEHADLALEALDTALEVECPTP